MRRSIRSFLFLVPFIIACERTPQMSIYDTELHCVSGDSVVSLQGFRGRPILIEFWSSGCSPCITSTGKLNSIHESFGRDLLVLFVNPTEDRQAVLDFIAERRIKATVLLDKEQRLYTRLGKPTLGTAFLCNREGTMVWSGLLYFLEERTIHATLEGGYQDDDLWESPGAGLALDITASNGKEINSISVSYDGIHTEHSFSRCSLSSVMITLLSQRYNCKPADIRMQGLPYGPYINLRARNQGGLPLNGYLDGIIGALQRMFELDIHGTEENGTVSIIVDYSRIRCPEGFKYYRAMDAVQDSIAYMESATGGSAGFSRPGE
jgi:thiol-disulfide isomerase/thioredoxin